MGIRQAVTLGMNLQNANKDVHKGSREIRYRVWWALCSIERTLSVMTGRPTSFTKNDCSVPLPLPVDEETLFADRSRLQTSKEKMPASKGRSNLSSNDYETSLLTEEIPHGSPVESNSSERQSPDQGMNTTPSDASMFLYSTTLGVLTDDIMKRLYRAGASGETWAQAQTKIADLNSKLDEWLRYVVIGLINPSCIMSLSTGTRF